MSAVVEVAAPKVLSTKPQINAQLVLKPMVKLVAPKVEAVTSSAPEAEVFSKYNLLMLDATETKPKRQDVEDLIETVRKQGHLAPIHNIKLLKNSTDDSGRTFSRVYHTDYFIVLADAKAKDYLLNSDDFPYSVSLYRMNNKRDVRPVVDDQKVGLRVKIPKEYSVEYAEDGIKLALKELQICGVLDSSKVKVEIITKNDSPIKATLIFDESVDDEAVAVVRLFMYQLSWHFNATRSIKYTDKQTGEMVHDTKPNHLFQIEWDLPKRNRPVQEDRSAKTDAHTTGRSVKKAPAQAKAKSNQGFTPSSVHVPAPVHPQIQSLNQMPPNGDVMQMLVQQNAMLMQMVMQQQGGGPVPLMAPIHPVASAQVQGQAQQKRGSKGQKRQN